MKPAVLAWAAAALLLAGCGEKPQTAATKQHDGKPWQTAQSSHSATGWKSGDQASWEEQLRTRTQQGQNEYTRVTAQP